MLGSFYPALGLFLAAYFLFAFYLFFCFVPIVRFLLIVTFAGWLFRFTLLYLATKERLLGKVTRLGVVLRLSKILSLHISHLLTPSLTAKYLLAALELPLLIWVQQWLQKETCYLFVLPYVFFYHPCQFVVFEPLGYCFEETIGFYENRVS